jgi:hypothetical protein
MTTYIYIWKTAQTDAHVDYAFSPEDGVQGLMRIELTAGNMDLLTPCPGDDTNTWFQCACKAVFNHWLAGNMPETTQYIYGA